MLRNQEKKGIKDIILENYSLFVSYLFLFFIFGTLSFGKAFSVLHIKGMCIFPIFVTEIVLFLSFFLVIFRFRQIIDVLKKGRLFWFALPFSIFWLMGIIYFLKGAFVSPLPGYKNMFVVRDVILSAYLFFVPLTIVIFAQEKFQKLFFWALFGGSILAILCGRYFIFYHYFGADFYYFIINTKTFNLALTYGIATAYLISYFDFVKKWRYKVYILIVLSVIGYTSFLLAVRASWIAFVVLGIFYLFYLRWRFIKLCLQLVPVFFLTVGCLWFIDFKLMEILKPKQGQTLQATSSIPDEQKTNKLVIEEKKKPEGEEAIDKLKSLKIFIGETTKLNAGDTELPFDAYGESSVPFHSILWRQRLWQETWELSWDSPWFGHGFGILPRYGRWKSGEAGKSFRDITGMDLYVLPAHNHILTIFFKMGSLGVLLFLTFNGIVFWKGMQSINRDQFDFRSLFLLGALGSLIYWHVMALFFDLIDSPPTNIFLWIFIGIILVASYNNQRSVRTNNKS